MRKFKFMSKAVVGMMAVAMTMGSFSGVAFREPTAVYAADTDTKSAYTITIDYSDAEATIQSNTKTDPYVILEVLKTVDATKASDTRVYYMGEENSIKIDISFLKLSKDCFLRVRGSSEPSTVSSDVCTVKAQPSKLKIKYKAGVMDKTKREESLAEAFSDGTTKISKEDIQNDAYQYRTLYGSYFTELSNFDPTIAEVAGTTILLRKAAVDDAADAKDNAPASAEVKVKIPAAPKAPKVTVDYAKGSFKFPKNTQAQIVYPGAPVEEVAASMKLDTAKADKLYGSTDGTTFTEITNDNLSTYFEVAEDGEVTVKGSCTFADAASSGNPVAGTEAVKYVEGTAKTPASDGKSEVTAWKDITATTADPKTVLGWFDETKDAAKTQELLNKGFTLVVHTKQVGKKAESVPNILVVEKLEGIAATAGKDNEVSVGDSKLSWETVENGIKYTGEGFEYYDSGKSKWVAIRSGNVVRTSVSADVEVEVRKAGVKTKGSEKMPSQSTTITVKKYVESGSGDNLPPAEKPKAETDGVVKIGTDKVVTIARSSSNGKIEFTVESGKGGLLEYSMDSGTTWKDITETTAAEAHDAAVTIQVRVKATTTADASPAENVAIAAREKAEKPTEGTGNDAGIVIVGGTNVFKVERNSLTKSTLKFTIGDNDLKATLEYRIGTTGDWADIPTDSLTDQATTEIKMYVRVKEAGGKAASEPLEITIAP